MTSISQNRLNLIMPQANVTAMNTAANTLKTNLPFNGEFALTDTDRNNILSMNVDNRQFVTDVIVELGISGNILPPFIIPANLQNDTTLHDQLEAIESRLENILQVVRDLKRMAAHEAYATALAVYKLYEMAAASGIPGAQESYDRLKARFEGQGGAPTQQDI